MEILYYDLITKSSEECGASFQNPFHICNDSPIIGDGYVGIFCTFQAVSHLAFVQRTSAAVYDQTVRSKLRRKFGSAGEFEIQFLPGVCKDPCGKFLCADISALPVVGAALADQQGIPVLQMVQNSGALYQMLQISLISCEQDGK